MTLEEKARNGFQMCRLPRCGTTAVMSVIEQLLPADKFTLLGEGCFSDMPFSWGPYHNQVLNWPKDIDPLHPDFSNTMELMRQNLGFGSDEECIDIIANKAHIAQLINPPPINDSSNNFKKIKVTLKDWIQDFNVRLDQKPNYDPNKLTFQIIRNPFDWLISIYSWNFMGIDSTPPQIQYALDLIKYDDVLTKRERDECYESILELAQLKKPYSSFNEFVDYVFQLPSNATWAEKCRFPFPYPMMDKCFFQPFDNNGNCKVDIFITFENLGQSLQHMLDLGGYDVSVFNAVLPSSLKKKQTNWGKNGKEFNDYKHNFYTSSKSIEKVKEVYKWDLETFHYDFNGPMSKAKYFINAPNKTVNC